MWNDKYFSYLRALFLEGVLKKSQQPENERRCRLARKNKVKTASRIFFEGDKNWDCVRSSSLKMRNRNLFWFSYLNQGLTIFLKIYQGNVLNFSLYLFSHKICYNFFHIFFSQN